MRLFDENKIHSLLTKWGDTFQGQDKTARDLLYDFIESEMRRYAVKQLEELKIRIHLFPADSKFLDATDALISEIKRKEVAK